MINLSQDQQNTIKTLYSWYKDANFVGGQKYITVGGYAGTGKTTILAFFRKLLNMQNPQAKVAFCSYTGKATQVLKSKLSSTGQMLKNDFIGTIHSLIYKTIEDERGVVLGWELKDDEDFKYDLIIVDEASMVDSKIWNDLLSFRIPIIAVGDHGQLPPINGNFNLMQEPHLKLEQIHRQAEENPIIMVSRIARNEGLIPYQEFGPNVVKYNFNEAGYLVEESMQNYNQDTLYLCGYNSSRQKINSSIRGNLGFELPIPMIGDRVICLRNNHKKQIFNGMVGEIRGISYFDDNSYLANIELDLGDNNSVLMYEGVISSDQFNNEQTLNNINASIKTQKMDLFDFGYALTVHKAQGSQSKKVILFEERFKQMTDDIWRKWLYTAVTRAQEELVIFG